MQKDNFQKTFAKPTHYCRMCEKTAMKVPFGPNKETPGGLSLICKPCWAAYQPKRMNKWGKWVTVTKVGAKK